MAVGRQAAPPAQRIVVLGASLAGMFAAAACAGGGRAVTVLERDVLPDEPEPRPGVPQGRQPHVLLYRGLLALQELLPDLDKDLRNAGAVDFDTGDLAWLSELGWSPYQSPVFRVLSATRPLLEHLVLRRVRDLPGLTVRDGVRVLSVRRGARNPWQVLLDDGSVLDADLVVDATGRGSRLTTWLAQAGVDRVPVSEVDARTGYATRVYAVPPGVVEPAGVVVLQTPRTLAGGIALPVEGDRWLVGAVGSGRHRPPRDADGFEAFLRALPDPAVVEVAEAGRPLSDVAVHRQTANRRHHYERVRSWPPGLLVVGDALCAFNPIYGQGIAVAACEALLLREAMERGLRPGTERHLLRDFGRLTSLPWGIATGEDLRMPSSGGAPTRAQAVVNRWTRELGMLSTHGDERAHRMTSQVYHLMAPPRVLAHPALLAAAARARVAGYGATNPRPRIVIPATPVGEQPSTAD